jgi:nucleoside-diphosphate-sugar epimerase
MRVFVTGATGALGRHLVPGLIAAGHDVTATTRTPGKVAQLRAAGAAAAVVDGRDRDAVIATVIAAEPDVIVHQMTALAAMRSLRRVDKVFAATNELRTRAPTTCWRRRSWRAPAGSSRRATTSSTSSPAVR